MLLHARRHFTLGCACLLVALVSGFGVTAQAEEVTASNLAVGAITNPGEYLNIGTTPEYTIPENSAVGQGFVSELTGTLTRIEVSVERWRALGSNPLTVSIWSANATGLPDSQLGSVAFQYTELPWSVLDSGLKVVDFSNQEIELIAGEQYVVVLTTPPPATVSAHYRARLLNPNENSAGISPLTSTDGGLTWQAQDEKEVGLVVFLNPVLPPPPPEPQAVTILIDPAELNLNPKRPKPVSVVVFGTVEFSVLEIDPDGAFLGDLSLYDAEIGTGAPVLALPNPSFLDVDGDGHLDVVFDFDLGEMRDTGAIDATTTELNFLANNGMVYGSDQVAVGGKTGDSSGGGNENNGGGNGKGNKK